MSKLYLSAAELAALNLPGFPSSRQAVDYKAKKENWPCTIIEGNVGRGGKAKVYPISTLPADIQAAVREQQAVKVLAETAPAPMPALPGTEIKTTAVALTERQRQTESARMGVLHAIENIMAQAGVSKETAIKTVLTNARMPEFAHLARLFEMARDERGASGDLPGVRTIKRWFSARDTHSLAPKIKQADMRIPDWAPLYLRFYQTPQAVSHRDAYEQFARTFMQQHPLGKLPSPWQCYRFVQKLGNVSRHKGRIGERELKNLKPYKVRDFLHLEPTEIYTCDGHTFDAEVMHPDSGKPYRPEITTIADVATRKIVGFSVDVAESGTAVLAAISDACERNGIPAIFYVDNGSGYRNKMMSDEAIGLMGRIGTTMLHSMPYSSQARGVIERLHQSVWVKTAQTLQTYVGAKMDPQARQLVHKATRSLLKKGVNLKQAAGTQVVPSFAPGLVLDFDTFVSYCRWTTDEYNNRPHRSLPKVTDENGKRRHMTPNEMWAHKIADGAKIVRIGEDEKFQLFLPQTLRTVQRGQVFFRKNRYFSFALAEYNGDTVRVAYDIHDAGHVWIYDDAGRMICRADWNGNSTDYMPVSVRDQAKDKRIDAQHRRLGVKAEIIEAARPRRFIETPADSVNMGGLTIDMKQLAEQGEKARLKMRSSAETAAPAKVEKQVRKAEEVKEAAAEAAPAWSVAQLTQAERYALYVRLNAQETLPVEAEVWMETYPQSDEYRSMHKKAQNGNR